jgi:hypothetical protein
MKGDYPFNGSLCDMVVTFKNSYLDIPNYLIPNP